MSSSSFSLLDTLSLSAAQILNLFEEADQLFRTSDARPSQSPVVASVFFEPSTRTRMSFQMAAYRLGCNVINLEMNGSTSISKGETFADTVLNIVAMGPDALVIRYGVSPELDDLLPRLTVPVLSGGSGVNSHPTQALLDAYTIRRAFGDVQGKRVLIVGDIKHSRVARSNFDVLTKLGAEISVAGPADLIPSDLPANVSVAPSLEEALPWADAYMGLRIQSERHAESDPKLQKPLEFQTRFGLNQARLKKLKKDAIIMHPGPINHGVEFSAEVLSDSRNKVLQQVANGVLVRAAVLKRALARASTTGRKEANV